MLYHYTNLLSARDIERDAVIKAAPIMLHRDPFGRDVGLVTRPLVWLTEDSGFETTVFVKMLVSGWPSSPVGQMCRFVIDGDIPCLALDQYGAAKSIPPEWFVMMLSTAAMSGSNWMDWRICETDITSKYWQAKQLLSGIGGVGGYTWKDM